MVPGIDGMPDGQQFIKNGKMALTIFQDAREQATGAVQVTKALLDKRKVQHSTGFLTSLSRLKITRHSRLTSDLHLYR